MRQESPDVSQGDFSKIVDFLDGTTTIVRPYVSNQITYSFLNVVPPYPPGTQSIDGFRPFNAPEQEAVAKALQQYSQIANVTFVEITDPDALSSAQIRFGVGTVHGADGEAWNLPGYDPVDSYKRQVDGVWYFVGGDGHRVLSRSGSTANCVMSPACRLTPISRS